MMNWRSAFGMALSFRLTVQFSIETDALTMFNEGYRKHKNTSDVSSAIPTRHLWSGFKQRQSLVPDPVQRFQA